MRKLAAGGGHSAALTDACSLKELCEFRLAATVNFQNASEIEDIASRTGSDALARLCGRLRYYAFMHILVYICIIKHLSLQPRCFHAGSPYLMAIVNPMKAKPAMEENEIEEIRKGRRRRRSG